MFSASNVTSFYFLPVCVVVRVRLLARATAAAAATLAASCVVPRKKHSSGSLLLSCPSCVCVRARVPVSAHSLST